MSAASGASFSPVTWDSEFFGKNIVRVDASEPTLAELTQLALQAKQQAVDCLYYLVSASSAEAARRAALAGFSLVDIRITLEGAVSPTSATDGVRGASPDDVPRLREIASVSHQDTRFYADGHLPRARCDELYATWIQRSVEDGLADAVLVIDGSTGPIGYVTCSRGDGTTGSIGLCAVANEARGSGVGGRLVSAALGWLTSQGVRRVSVVTQGKNLGAQRLYQRAGLYTRNVELWYHLWPSPGE